MPKTSRKQIIEDEKKVIRQLLTNANESVDKIAKKCGFSRQKVWRIIKRLEKNNTIWGYTAIVDNDKIDRKNYTILIKKTPQPLNKDILKKITTRALDEEAAKNRIEISSSFYLDGRYDWMLCFTALGIKDAKKFCDIINNLYKGYIKDIVLMEKIFINRKCGILNPHPDRIVEFTAVK